MYTGVNFRHRPGSPFIAGALIAMCAIAASAQDLSLYKGRVPKDLFDQSWLSPSSAEKVAIRTWLLRSAPDTEYGCFSKAWLSDYEGDGHAKELYQACAQKFPDSLPILWNLRSELNGAERLAVLQHILQIDPSFQDYGAIRDVFFRPRESSVPRSQAEDRRCRPQPACHGRQGQGCSGGRIDPGRRPH
jgi:hypothetical protein